MLKELCSQFSPNYVTKEKFIFIDRLKLLNKNVVYEQKEIYKMCEMVGVKYNAKFLFYIVAIFFRFMVASNACPRIYG